MDPNPTPAFSATTSPDSNSTNPPRTAGDLPPEAIALAGRIFDAARNGQVEMFEQALPRGLSANLTNDKGDSLIMLSSYHGHTSIVRLLLSHSADPNRLNERGQSPLAGAVFKMHSEVIEALLEGGADPTLGQPSALDSAKLFKQDQWIGKFEHAKQDLRDTGQGAVNGH